jgi:hypothetical protein
MDAWMEVGPTDDGGFEMKVDRADGLTMTAIVRVAHGRPVCHTLELRTKRGQIDRDLLRTLGLATLLRRAASVTAVPLKRMPVEKQPGLTDEFLAKVAAAYRLGLAPTNRETTASAVAKLGRERVEQYKTDAPVSTVGRWIKAAEDRGFLERTVQGRKRRISKRSRNPAGGAPETETLVRRSLPRYSKRA